jgi:hypothetical protein
MSSPKTNGADGDQPPTPDAKLFRSNFTSNKLALRIPPELREREQWVLWRREHGTKVPYGIDQRKASTINPRHWSNYAAVIKCFESWPKQFAGIGFVFHECDQFVGIDLDDCLEDTIGNVKPCVQLMLERFSDTYIETSPSGLGLKIWCLGKLPAALKAPWAMAAVSRCTTGPPTPRSLAMCFAIPQRVPCSRNAPASRMPRCLVPNGDSGCEDEPASRCTVVRRSWHSCFSLHCGREETTHAARL